MCKREIGSGEHYFTVLIAAKHIQHHATVPESGIIVDAHGNVRVDVCWQCRTERHLSGEEMVD